MKRCSIEKIANTLKKFRDNNHDLLGAGELSELEAVLIELEEAAQSTKPEVSMWDLSYRALQIIGVIYELTTKITDRW